ncbi:MAG: histidinol dehydrogenase, partial [Alphaproteobacteria bacterium]
MTRQYLKKASRTSRSDARDVQATVRAILDDIEEGGDAKALEYAARFDRYEGNVVLTADEIAAAAAQVPDRIKADIRFAHDNVRRFAELQKSTVQDVQMEVVPG